MLPSDFTVSRDIDTRGHLLGQIDVVVVYKVDRLTRSLMDFTALVNSAPKSRISEE
jgi:DNA invertase Pin-like site-specific DNA recombinase